RSVVAKDKEQLRVFTPLTPLRGEGARRWGSELVNHLAALATSAATPSPLNGERAGVRGVTAPRSSPRAKVKVFSVFIVVFLVEALPGLRILSLIAPPH